MTPNQALLMFLCLGLALVIPLPSLPSTPIKKIKKTNLYSSTTYHHVAKPTCYSATTHGTTHDGTCSYDEFVEDFYPHSIQEAKVLMAQTLRILAALGYDEGVDGHLTYRLPEEWLAQDLKGEKDSIFFLVDRLGVGWSHIQASQIVLIQDDGKGSYEILDSNLKPTGHQDWRAAVWMNGALHRARPDLEVILHTHSPYQRLHGASRRTIPMVDQNALRFYKRFTYVSYPGIAVDSLKAAHLAEPFKSFDILLLRNHGAIFGTKTLQNALSLCYFLEKVLVMTHGLEHDEPLHPVDPQVVAKTAAKLQGQAEELMAVFLFESLVKRFD